MDFSGRVFLAPLTKGGNLPFRRLCIAHGCEVTMSEMAYAYQLLRGNRRATRPNTNCRNRRSRQPAAYH